MKNHVLLYMLDSVMCILNEVKGVSDVNYIVDAQYTAMFTNKANSR